MPTILIVEDDEDIRDALAELAREEGYRVVGVTHGAAALAHLEALERQGDRPTLILLDLRMPLMNGREFLALRAQRPHLASIPVVVVTADATAVAALDLPGVAAVVTKPFTIADLMAVMETLAGPPSGVRSASGRRPRS